jgi:hypothetical protein
VSTTTRFRDLAIGDTFDWVDPAPGASNSFFCKCKKIGARSYETVEPVGAMGKLMDCRVGTINARVYHVRPAAWLADDLVSINAEQRLYVLPCGDGYSCLGFDYAERRRAAVTAWAGYDQSGEPWLSEQGKLPAPGTVEHFKAYQQAMRIGERHNRITGERCGAELTPALLGLEGKRVEVTAPDGEARRFIVGKSTGWIPCHLEIETRASNGGGSAYVPEGAIVRVLA